VGPLKKEIDLRPREFIRARFHPKRRLAAGILAVAAAGAVLLCLILAEQCIGRLNREVTALRQGNQALAARAAPLAQMEEAYRALEEKASLQAALQQQKQPWSRYLRQIEAALPDYFHLQALAADDRGRLTLTGSGPALPGIAAYSQALQQLPFIRSSAVSRIDLEADGSYRFLIQADLEEEDRS
jgi:Tfp pilus assembly protein PilN